MSVTPSPIGGFAAQFFDNNGVILSGGKIYTYSAGTTTPQATYTSAVGVTPHANPIILDSAGRVPGGEIWLTDGLVYKFVIETSTGILLGTYDNITGVNSNFVNYTIQEEVITATAGQTVFNLSTINYTPATNSLSVYIDGVNQYVGDSYLETDSNTVTFTSGVHVGGEVKFTTALQVATGAMLASDVGFTQDGTGAVAQTVQTKLEQFVSIEDFGAVGDGVTDNTTAIQAARDYAATRSYAGNTTSISWPAGRYIYTVSPNWAITGLQMDFQGEVWLINEGSGVSFLFDGGATGTGVYGIQITGFPRIYGDAGTQHGIYLRSIYRSTFDVNVRGAGTAYSGFYGEWLVSNTINFIMNFNEGGLYSVPAYGVTLTARTSDGLQSGWNNFWNPECSGLPVGFYVDGAFGTKVFGGAIQNNTKGAVVTSNAESTVFYGTDFEANATNDIEDAGNNSQYIGCDFEKGPRFLNGARGGKIIGGVMQNIYVNSGAINTLLSGCSYDWALVPGTGTITDAGTRTRYRDVRGDVSNLTYNVPYDQTVLTVGASPYTYTNTSGNDQEVIVSGGIVTGLTLSRFAGYPTGLAGGQFRLTSGDSIIVTYTLGSPPAMVTWTT